MKHHNSTKILSFVIVTSVLLSCQVLSPLLSPTSPSEAEKQFLENSDAEKGNDSPAAWFSGGTEFNNLGFEVLWSSDQAFSNSHSLEISLKPGFETEEFMYWSQTVPISIPHDIPAGTGLRLETMIMLEDMRGNGIAIAVRADDTKTAEGEAEAIASTERLLPITGTKDWTAYSVTLWNISSGIKSITVYLLYLPDTSGTAYFDNITLTVVE